MQGACAAIGYATASVDAADGSAGMATEEAAGSATNGEGSSVDAEKSSVDAPPEAQPIGAPGVLRNDVKILLITIIIHAGRTILPAID